MGSRKAKASALLVSGMMTAAVLASTAGGNAFAATKDSALSKQYAGQTIKVLLSAGSVGQFNYWQAEAPQFTKETGIKVKFVIVNYNNLLQDITTAGIANTGTYDVVAYLDVMGPSIANFLQPLSGLIQQTHYDVNRFPAAYLGLSTYNGQLESLPVRAHAQMLFYRKDLFKKLGLSVPKTWTQLETDGKKIQKATGVSGIVPYYAPGNNGQNLYMWTAYLWSHGGDIFDKNNKPIFNSPRAVQATQRYIDLLRKEKIAPASSLTFGEQDARTYFEQGKSAMFIGWSWAYADFITPGVATAKVDKNVGFAPVPGWSGAAQPNVSTFPLGIMRGSKHQGAAWEFLEWISNPKFEYKNAAETFEKKAPASQDNVVVVEKQNLTNPKLNKLSDGFYNVIANDVKSAHTLPKLPEWPQVSDLLSQAISSMATGKPVKATLDSAEKQVYQIMKNAGYYKN